MNRKMILAVLVLAALPLVGCAGPELTQYDLDGEIARANSRTNCIQALAQAETARAQAIARMPESQQALAMMADAMARQSEALAGKDRCGTGMNAAEARVRIAEAQNRTFEGLGGKVLTSSVIGLGLYTFGDVAKHGIDKAGDKTSIQGDGNSYTQERVQNTSETSTRALGDGAQANSAAPVVAGPDKSSHTTIEAPAEPELPEVEEPEGEFVPTEPPDFPDGPVEIPGPEAAE